MLQSYPPQQQQNLIYHAKNIARSLTLSGEEIYFEFFVKMMEFMGWLVAEYLLH